MKETTKTIQAFVATNKQIFYHLTENYNVQYSRTFR